MPETMSPREKVARIIDPAAFLFTADELMKGDPSQFNALAKADQIFAALASSGDHAELARLAGAAKRVRRDSQGNLDGTDAYRRWEAFTAAANPATVLALIAEVAALRGAKWEVQHVDTMNDMVLMGMARDDAEARATEAERKLAEAVRLLRRIDRTYADMQDGNGNHPTELRKVRTFLSSKEAERG